MAPPIITDDRQLRVLCDELAGAERIALDTEFVSEHTYRPQLCLVQVAAAGRLALVDALAVGDMTPFWEVLAREGHETIVHAGRGEVEFSIAAVGRPPAGLFDVQIAAGLVGIEYPAGYGSLMSKLLGRKTEKHETRTDWRRRPLAGRQLEYALDDVRYLEPIRDALVARLEKLGRRAWLAEEMRDWEQGVETSLNHERWRRVSGNSGLDSRSLAVLRELWRWREDEARRRDKPARRVLRDDLLVELARRKTADLKRIGAIRGLERGDLRRHLPAMAKSVARALALPENECPAEPRRLGPPQQPSVLGQFLFAALGSICREANLAPGLVGGPNDVRDWILHRNRPAHDQGPPPALARGWRAEVVGQLFDDLLSGNVSIRIGDPDAEHPLVFDRRPNG